jgi:DNA repair exonuclease SbcCD ATPase subunit
MKKYILILLLALNPLMGKSSPWEVAQNIFQEYRQVEEMIRQIMEVIRQIEQQAEMIKNMSGKDIFEMTAEELELLSWLPDDVLDPTGDSPYSINFQEMKEKLDLPDPFESLGIEQLEDSYRLGPLATARKEKQQATVASATYAKTFMNQFEDRVDVLSGYLNDLDNAETLKNSVDLGARVTAQAVINQIEINRTFAMLLKQKSAEVATELADERYTLMFLKGDE